MWTEVMSKLLWSVKLSFLIAIQLCIITVHIVSSGQTWFHAQEFCQKHNDLLTLDISKSDDFYWTGNYQRLSNWINILGCYKEAKFDNLDISFKMEMASAGLCQELCNIKNYSTFAIKTESCVCMNDDFISPLEHTDTTSCNFVCNNTIDDKLSTLCGGPEAFNVFTTEMTSLPNPGMGNCISLECSAASTNFAVHNCSDPRNVICTSKVTRDEYKSWREHLKTCANHSLYPAGKVEFSNASSSCNSLRLNTTDPKWVGIIQEMYLTRERGNYNYRQQRKKVLMCQKCKSGSCLFSNCNEKLTNLVFCRNTTVQLTSTITEADEDLLGGILAPIIIIVVTGIIVFLGVFIYRRRQKFQTEGPGNIQNDVHCSSEAMNDKYSEAQNQARSESYFVLEESNQNYDLTAHTNNNAGNSYGLTEEGQYDHLRGKDHLRKETDDTYHHASPVKASDYSDYDVTRTQNVPEIENTYDKAGQNEKSEYEYNELKLRG